MVLNAPMFREVNHFQTLCILNRIPKKKYLLCIIFVYRGITTDLSNEHIICKVQKVLKGSGEGERKRGRKTFFFLFSCRQDRETCPTWELVKPISCLTSTKRFCPKTQFVSSSPLLQRQINFSVSTILLACIYDNLSTTFEYVNLFQGSCLGFYFCKYSSLFLSKRL